MIKGYSYRSNRSKFVFSKKSDGNTAYLVRHPTNKFDKNAIGIYVESDDLYRDSGFNMYHIGYISKNDAKHMSSVWPTENGHPLVVIGNLDANKSCVRLNKNTNARQYYLN